MSLTLDGKREVEVDDCLINKIKIDFKTNKDFDPSRRGLVF